MVPLLLAALGLIPDLPDLVIQIWTQPADETAVEILTTLTLPLKYRATRMTSV